MDVNLLLGPVAITLVLGGISILLLYWLSVRHYSYWKKLGIPQAETVPLLGSIHRNFNKDYYDVENARYKKLGRIYGHYEGSSPCLSVGDPLLLRDILVKDFASFHDRRIINTGTKVVDNMLSIVRGEDWKRIRRIVSPTFSTGKIKRMLSILKECSRIVCDNIVADAKSRKYVEIKRLYEAFTMDVIASSAFSTKIDSHRDPENEFVQMAKQTFNEGLSWGTILFFVAPKVMKLFGISGLNEKPLDFFANVTRQIIDERKKSGKSRNDFLQLLMDTAKEVSEEEKWETEDKNDITSNYGQEDVERQILKNVMAKHLSMDELLAQCVIFFFAGYHTTAATLSFATYNLAMKQEVQDKLRKEVDEILKENNGSLTYEAVQSMKYLDNVISETLRLYPPAVRLERVANGDYDLGDTGITIRKGMLVSVPVYAMHRDPEFYPDPKTFDPDRFTPEERDLRNPYTYLPFGAGPRNCVGMRFALMEIKVCLAYIVAKFVLRRCPETKVPLELFFGQGLLKSGDVTLDIEIRKDSVLHE